MIGLTEHFGVNDRGRDVDALHRRSWFIKSRQDKNQCHRAEDKLEGDILAFAAETVMAVQMQIEAFEKKLDTYDHATVQALMENRSALDAIRAQMDILLAEAYVMEDGRRVFKTEDGTQVFDEHGIEVSADEVDFDSITADRPSWESYEPYLMDEQRLVQEQTELLEFQKKLDDARETLDGEDITEADLAEIEAGFAETVPASVKRHMPRFDSADNAPALKSAFTTPSNSLSEPKVPQAGTDLSLTQ